MQSLFYHFYKKTFILTLSNKENKEFGANYEIAV